MCLLKFHDESLWSYPLRDLTSFCWPYIMYCNQLLYFHSPCISFFLLFCFICSYKHSISRSPLYLINPIFVPSFPGALFYISLITLLTFLFKLSICFCTEYFLRLFGIPLLSYFTYFFFYCFFFCLICYLFQRLPYISFLLRVSILFGCRLISSLKFLSFHH